MPERFYRLAAAFAFKMWLKYVFFSFVVQFQIFHINWERLPRMYQSIAPALWWLENIWIERGWWGVWLEKKAGEEREGVWGPDLETLDPTSWTSSRGFSRAPANLPGLPWCGCSGLVGGSDSATVLCQEWLRTLCGSHPSRRLSVPPPGAGAVVGS